MLDSSRCCVVWFKDGCGDGLMDKQGMNRVMDDNRASVSKTSSGQW